MNEAHMIVTIHGIDHLDAVKLAELTQMLSITFGDMPTINTNANTIEARISTSDHISLFRVVDWLVDELARKYSPLLWVSVGSDWRQS